MSASQNVVSKGLTSQNLAVISSFNLSHLASTVPNFIHRFFKFWPLEQRIYLYNIHRIHAKTDHIPQIELLDELSFCPPNLRNILPQEKEATSYLTRFICMIDAIERFKSHKKYLVWIDCDVYMLKSISLEQLETMLPEDHDLMASCYAHSKKMDLTMTFLSLILSIQKD